MSAFTTGSLARRLGVPVSRVRKIFSTGKLPEPERCGLNRIISPALARRVEAALRRAGQLPDNHTPPSPQA